MKIMGNAWWQAGWIWSVTGWTLATIGLALLAWAIFWDRSRGRKRCPKCWYDMSGAAITDAARIPESQSLGHPGKAVPAHMPCVCPECGRQITRTGQLFRTRRRLGYAAVACLFVCIGFQTSRIGTAGRQGAVGYVPTLVLIACVSDFWDESSPLAQALVARLQSNNVFPWDKPIAAWAELRRSQFDWSEAIAYRKKWPVGESMRVELVRPKGAWSIFCSRVVSLKWLDGEAAEASANCNPPQIHAFVVSSPQDWIDLPPPKLGSNELRFEASVQDQYGGRSSGMITINVEGVSSIDEAITPASDTGIADEIRGSLIWSTYVWQGTAGLWVGPRENWIPARRDLAYALTGELLRANTRAATDRTSNFWMSPLNFCVLPDTSAAKPAENPIDLDDLVVRVSGSPQLALRQIRYSHYWNGVIEVPLSSLPWQFSEGRNSKLLNVNEVRLMPFDDAAQRELAKTLR